MSEAKRREKRFRRENRPNKGAGTTAKIRARNADIRGRRQEIGSEGILGDGMLLALAMLGGKR